MLLLVILTLVQTLWAVSPGGSSSCESWWTWAADKAPGVGWEYETADWRFTTLVRMTVQQTIDLKWKRITQIGRTIMGGVYWELTVDATLKLPGVLVAEVILDGKRLRVGYPDAVNTANEAAQAIVQSRKNSFWHDLN